MVGTRERQASVQLRLGSTDELMAEMKRRRAALRAIVAEQKAPDSNLLIDDYFDGIWSLSLRRAVKAHSALGIEVRQLWTMLPPDWKCPCCGRTKLEIVMVVDGVLLAKAVQHHDHFISRINQAFRQGLGEAWSVKYPGSGDKQRSIGLTFVRFSPVVICESCNQADANGKRAVQAKLGLPAGELEDFSFSIEEIREFIRARPNRRHDIIDSEVIKIFTERRTLEGLRFRRDTVEQQVEMIRTGAHWGATEAHPSEEDLYELAYDRASELGVAPSSNFNIFDFSATSITGEEPANLWRRNRTGRIRTPADVDIHTFVASKSVLAAVGLHWRCPSCDRSLGVIVRYNSKGHIFAGMGSLGRHDAPVQICMDCAEVVTGLAKEAKVRREAISIADVDSVIRAVRHARHRLKSEHGTDRIIENIALREMAVDTPEVGIKRRSGSAIHSFSLY